MTKIDQASVGETPDLQGAPRNLSLIARAFKAIEYLAEAPRTGSEVAQRFGVDRSTALRLLHELEKTGYVARFPGTKRYATVGTRFYRLIESAPDHSDLSELVDPMLRAIREAFGEAAVLAVPSRGSMVYVGFYPSTNILAVREHLGALRPMHCSAVGKAYLSGVDEAALADELARLTFEGGTEHAAKDARALMERITVARELGYALDRDETSLGVSCVATPLFVEGSLIGAVGVTGPTTRLTDQLVTTIGRRLHADVTAIGPIRAADSA